MNNEDRPKLALRVFKRTNKYLILLFRRLDGIDPSQAEISFRALDPKAQPAKTVRVDPKFVLVEQSLEVSDGVNISPETVICMVKEVEAGLDPGAIYYVKVRYGGEEEGLRVTPAGVFPSHEREDRQKNVHLMGWDDEGQMWRKLSAVKGPRGRWYLGTICAGCSQEQHADQDSD